MTPTTPDFTAARDHVIQEVVGFTRRLRADGVAVPATAAIPTVKALAEVGLNDRERVRVATHATLIAAPGDRPTFDDHFPTFWYRLRTGLEATAAAADGDGDQDGGGDNINPYRPATTEVEGILPDATGDEKLPGDATPVDEEVTRRVARVTEQNGTTSSTNPDRRPGTYSPTGRPTGVPETDGETVEPSTIRRFERALATRPGRRWLRSRTGTGIDLRQALRDSLDTGGITISLPWRERNSSALRICILVDVSRSVLDALDRDLLLGVLDELVAVARTSRVFFFDTDIREVTQAFAQRHGDPTEALDRAEVTWGGGTRIGSSLTSLRKEWPDAVDRRTVTLVVSDGLEVGDVPELTMGMSWLAHRAGSVIWLNPLATSTAYEPICRGMEAALPYVDGLFAFGGTEDLAEIVRQLERHGTGGPIGFEYDFRERGGAPAR